jgi:hypothetical protein
MKFRLLTPLAALLFAGSAPAQTKLDSLNAGLQTYSNVVVLGFNATDLYFTHAAGIANVKLKLLDAPLREQFHYDPVVAAQAERQQAESDARYIEGLGREIQAEARRTAPAARDARTWAELGLADPFDDKSPLNHPAPEIAVEQWPGPKPDTKGKLTLVVFWSLDSNASRAVLPQVNGWNRTHVGKLLILGVTPDSERDLAQADGPKPEFLSGSDPHGKLAAALAVRTLPCCVLIDPAGYVRFHGHPAALDDKKFQAIFAHVAE